MNIDIGIIIPNKFLPITGYPLIYLYTLSDPETSEVVYVGKTSNPEQRFSQHTSLYRRGNPLLYEWVEQLLDIGKLPVMAIVEVSNWKEVKKREYDLIREYWECGCPLVNDNGVRFKIKSGGVSMEFQMKRIVNSKFGIKRNIFSNLYGQNHVNHKPF